MTSPEDREATTSELSAAWDEHAATYQRLGAPFTGYIAQSLFQTVAGRLPPAPRVLDIACGNGELSRAALLHCVAERTKSGHAGSIVATDFSGAMVELAAKNVRDLGGDDLVRCEVHDGQALGLESASFDAVFSSFGIFLFPDRQAGWREAARVLRPGGWLATAVWRGPEDNALIRLQMGPVMAALPARIRANMPRAGWLDIASRVGLASELASCGFGEIEVSIFDAILTAPSARTMWEFMLENPPTKELFSQCTKDELAEIERSVLSSFEALAGAPDRALRFDASCHFALARRSSD